MLKLSVNVDHVATLREARKGIEPDPVHAAVLAELGGAQGITVHLRADRRHIQERDVRLLRAVCQTRLDLEMAATPEMVRIASDVRPDVVTLVPERQEEITTEGGLDLGLETESVRSAITELHEAGILVSLFVDPDPEQIRAGHRLDADGMEINTARYCEVRDELGRGRELEKVVAASKLVSKLGMRLYAGHGLGYRNVRPVARIPEMAELNIGHSILARAALVGMERAVREMVALIEGP
jgi:pyridoxine 5-phosphate synthase